MHGYTSSSTPIEVITVSLALSPDGLVPATYREPLCPSKALSSPGQRLALPRPALPGLHRSYKLMRQSKFLMQISVSFIPQVFAGCCVPLLEDGPSQRYSANLSLDAWTHTPAIPTGALTRFFPGDNGLRHVGSGSALNTMSVQQLQYGRFLGATVIY
jgi:hypothetical protein